MHLPIQFASWLPVSGVIWCLAAASPYSDQGIGLSLYNPDFDSQGQYSILRALRQQPLLPSP